MQPDDDADVPSPIDLRTMKDATEWTRPRHAPPWFATAAHALQGIQFIFDQIKLPARSTADL